MSGNTNKESTPTPTTEVEEAPATRDDIRAAIFGAKPDKKDIVFFGKKIELRQPTMGVVMEYRQMQEVDQMTQMLVNYAYVPGTDQHVFEQTDEEAIKSIPFGPDMNRLQLGINELIGTDLEGIQKQIEDAMKTAGQGSAKADDDVGGGGAGEVSG